MKTACSPHNSICDLWRPNGLAHPAGPSIFAQEWVYWHRRGWLTARGDFGTGQTPERTAGQTRWKQCPHLDHYIRYWTRLTVTWPKIEIIEIQDGGSRHLENRFLAITHQPTVGFQRNFVWWNRTACWQGLWDKNANVQNPRWRTAAILKIVKSLYLNEKLSDFDEIWYTTSDIEPDYGHVTKN